MNGIRRAGNFLAPVALSAGLLAAGRVSEKPTPAPSPVPSSSEAESVGQSFHAPAGALIAPGKAPDLTLLFTGDVLGFIDPCG